MMIKKMIKANKVDRKRVFLRREEGEEGDDFISLSSFLMVGSAPFSCDFSKGWSRQNNYLFFFK